MKEYDNQGKEIIREVHRLQLKYAGFSPVEIKEIEPKIKEFANHMRLSIDDAICKMISAIMECPSIPLRAQANRTKT